MSNIIHRAFLLSALIAATASPQAQAPPHTATGLIVGRAVDGVSGAPVTNVIISLSGPGTTGRRVIVDPQGRFAFTDLPAGAFTISSTKTGYLDGAYGKTRPDGLGRSLELRDGERITDATVRMWRCATISGTVTDDADDPVTNATVQVWRRMVTAGHWRLTSTGRTAATDERGVYRVIGLPPGDYALVITSLTSSLPVSLLLAADASKRAESAAQSDFYRLTQTNGTFGFVNDLIQGSPTMRVGDVLLQGSAIAAGDGRSVSIYPTVWYPSASAPAQATIVSLAAGENRTGIDLHTTLTATARISGTVMGPDGAVPYLALRLAPAGLDDVAAEYTTSLAASFNVAMTSTDVNGAFTFMAVPPGQYLIRALTTPRPLPEPPAASTTIQTADGMSRVVSAGAPLTPMLSKEPSLWTAVPVSVGDKDVAGVSVTMRPGLHVTGRVEFDGAATKPVGNALRAMKVSLEPADGRSVWYAALYQAQVDPAGEFYSAGMTAGSYVLRVDSAPSGWTVQSAMMGGHDILDTPLVLDTGDLTGLIITFTDHPSRVSGSVRASQGGADNNAAVLAFPTEGPWTDLGTNARRLAATRPSRAGTYALSGLPPGNYDIVAIGDEMTTNWQDPAFLQKLARVATHVTIGEGQGLSVDLMTAVVR